jgi:hypothetical protein
MVRKDAVARSHLDLNDTGRIFDMRMAVWHHSIDGPPHRTDYMDVEIVRGMIGRGFRLGLYGHQHRTQAVPHQVWLPDRERMAVVSAGSLCAGAHDLPTGTYRQYNILEISGDFRRVRAHVREMAVANLFSRGRLPDFGGLSYADLDWEPARDLTGGLVDVGLQRVRAAVEEAEGLFKAGDAPSAVSVLQRVELPPNSYQRQLFLAAAVAAGDWAAIERVTVPPLNVDELIQRVEACARLGDFTAATATLDEYAGPLHLPTAQENELRRRLSAQQGMRR